MCVPSLSFVYEMYCVDLDLPLNQRTRGGGAPVAWHSSTASAPAETWIACWVTLIRGASGGKIGILLYV